MPSKAGAAVQTAEAFSADSITTILIDFARTYRVRERASMHAQTIFQR